MMSAVFFFLPAVILVIFLRLASSQNSPSFKQYLSGQRKNAAFFLPALALSACSSFISTPPVYHSETFEAESPYQFHYATPADDLCVFGKRALLSQGYEVDGISAQKIKGAKFFQPKADEQLQLHITLVCLPTGQDNVGTIYASALQSRFALKSDGNSTGLSVAGLGSITLPWPNDKGALVKVGEETIADPEFYRRLFVLIEQMAKKSPALP